MCLKKMKGVMDSSRGKTKLQMKSCSNWIQSNSIKFTEVRFNLCNQVGRNLDWASIGQRVIARRFLFVVQTRTSIERAPVSQSYLPLSRGNGVVPPFDPTSKLNLGGCERMKGHTGQLSALPF